METTTNTPTTRSDVDAAWEALAAVTHTPELTEPMARLARLLENCGLQVAIIGGALYADDITNAADGQAIVHASFRIEQEA